MARKKVTAKAKANAPLGRMGKERKANHRNRRGEPSLVQEIAGCAPRQSNAIQISIREGFPFGTLALLANAYGVSLTVMVNALAIPAGSIRRRRSKGVLLPSESDRAYRLAQVYDLAFPMMIGDAQATAAWLCTPLDILGNESPFQRADTCLGYEDVGNLIGRLRHGVFC